MAELEIAKFLLQQNRDLSAQVVELSKVLVELVRPQPYIDPTFQDTYVPEMSEMEEDARWLLESGRIDQTQLRDLLSRAGVPNTEVVSDTEL